MAPSSARLKVQQPGGPEEDKGLTGSSAGTQAKRQTVFVCVNDFSDFLLSGFFSLRCGGPSLLFCICLTRRACTVEGKSLTGFNSECFVGSEDAFLAEIDPKSGGA